METARARAGETLDALIWRARGLGPDDLPAVLAANPGLAALGPILPVGTAVILPDVPPAARQRDVVQLWT
ncbi:MAG: tail protein X [Sphingomonas parapaucimobilis]